MKTLRASFYGQNEANIEQFKSVVANIENFELTILATEEDAVNAMSSKSFDLLVLDYELEKLVQNRLHKMTEMVYPEAAYTSISFEHPSFVIFKINQLVQNWNEANNEGEQYKFIDNPL